MTDKPPDNFERGRRRATISGERRDIQTSRRGSHFCSHDALDRARIKRHSISSRVKALPSLLDKAERKQLRDPLTEMNDIVGVRVVCLFLSDIDRIGQEIRSCFEVVGEDNKIEGEPASSFGYMSVHFVSRLKREYKGPRYDRLLE